MLESSFSLTTDVMKAEAGSAAVLNAELLKQYGFDIIVPFRTDWYNDMLNSDSSIPETLMRLDDNKTAYLIGNTKAIWGPFVEWCKECHKNDSHKNQRHEKCCTSASKVSIKQYYLPKNPIDTYCQDCIEKSIVLSEKDDYNIHYSNNFDCSTLISMQRVAVCSGHAYHDSATQLTIHPMYGVWTSYRAVIVVNDTSKGFSSISPPDRLDNSSVQLTQQDSDRAKLAMKNALAVSKFHVNDDTNSSSNNGNINSMSTSTLDSSGTNLCEQLHCANVTKRDVAEAWIMIRDAIGIGKMKYRYSTNQLYYHYTKDLQYIYNEIIES